MHIFVVGISINDISYSVLIEDKISYKTGKRETQSRGNFKGK